MANDIKLLFTYISHDILKQLTKDELLIYCFVTLRANASFYNSFTFTSSLLNYELNVKNRNQKESVKDALRGLTTKELILNPHSDIYIAKATMKPNDANWLVVYNIEVETLKDINNSIWFQYFCFLITRLDNKTQRWGLANSYIESGFNGFFESKITISKPTIIKYNSKLKELGLIEVLKQSKDRKNEKNIIKRVNVDVGYINKKDSKTTEANKLSNTTKEDTKIATPKKSKSNFDNDNLKKRISEVIGVNESEFKLTKSQREKIEEVGQDEFISILKSNIHKYVNILYGAGFQENAQYKINTILKRVFENDLKREMSEMKQREAEQKRRNSSSDEGDRFFTEYMNNNEDKKSSPKVLATDLSWALDDIDD